MTGVKRLKISTRSLHIRGSRGCVIWRKYHEIFDGVNFVNKKLKKVGVGIFYLDIILYLCCMNKYRRHTPALLMPLHQMQEAQTIDACGVSKKYSNYNIE